MLVVLPREQSPCRSVHCQISSCSRFQITSKILVENKHSMVFTAACQGEVTEGFSNWGLFLKLECCKGGIENILVVTDHFTKYAQAYPTRDQKATTVAKVIWENFIIHYGLPVRIHSDKGRNFEGQLLRELCKVCSIKKTRTTPYHPQGNGLTERFNHTLLNMFGTHISNKIGNNMLVPWPMHTTTLGMNLPATHLSTSCLVANRTYR